jgi:hypothetical protein
LLLQLKQIDLGIMNLSFKVAFHCQLLLKLPTDFNVSSLLSLDCFLELLVNLLSFGDVLKILLFQLGEHIHQLLWLIEEKFLIIKVLGDIDQVEFEQLLKPHVPLIFGHDLGLYTLLWISLLRRAGVIALILEQLLYQEVIISHAVLVQLAHLNPVRLDLVKLRLFASNLLLAPLWALLLKNAEEESLVLLE